MESGASPLDGTRNEDEDVRLWAVKSTQVLNQCQMSEFRLEGRNLATQERQVTKTSVTQRDSSASPPATGGLA